MKTVDGALLFCDQQAIQNLIALGIRGFIGGTIKSLQLKPLDDVSSEKVCNDNEEMSFVSRKKHSETRICTTEGTKNQLLEGCIPTQVLV